MLDPELKAHLETIEKEIIALRLSSTSFRATFVRGVVHGAGYIIGVVLIIVLVGWVLNVVGIIPAFNNEVTAFREALERIGGPLK